ncbi:hypothetical protein C8Q73DRAFT_109742 [Cubamyces lactineus]|nr:hypothetical protein C8Q73DRAFT_109742 [Cubamyces lactineus]
MLCVLCWRSAYVVRSASLEWDLLPVALPAIEILLYLCQAFTCLLRPLRRLYVDDYNTTYRGICACSQRCGWRRARNTSARTPGRGRSDSGVA